MLKEGKPFSLACETLSPAVLFAFSYITRAYLLFCPHFTSNQLFAASGLILLGATVIVLPFVTGESIALWGIRRSVLAAGIAACVLIAMGLIGCFTSL